MTYHVALAGSVLAGVALWVGVYTALLPNHAPASSHKWEVSTSEGATSADFELEASPPRRWADLPREAPVSASDLPVREESLSTAIVPDLGHARPVDRPDGLSQIRRVARPDILIRRRLIGERAYTPRRVHARPRYRRRQEPIQFSLATRSSS
ncbi:MULTISPECIES: hypothetical protein [Methylobacterium]|jgi:hypothetical protein|uniref:Uncharacterized protein n=1 Tax=Methylobacterium longum TaxID=767694 RepID=A0ABT8AWU6_9HYPH|nr:MULTISPECIES: hypothetical protein [Methylobacterium]MCJ2103702.1 hypothetical protein [Methylobacterium sp. E-046]MDN3574293.1 hypothetical protein [Methylobacterium longum]